jgi:hypothetical protein
MVAAFRAAALAVALAGAACAAHASVAPRSDADLADLCLHASDAAADAHGVPRDAMRALTRTETGRPRGGALQPWPWTVNMEGEGRWFDSRQQALSYVLDRQRAGARSFDIGCFQINHRWHGDAFPSVQAMFEPRANADYAARFLRELYAETGDWTEAAGLYHSRTPEFRDRYQARFERILASGNADVAQPDDVRHGERRTRPQPLIAEVARALPPAAAGAIAISVLRGGLSPLRGAVGPLIGN